MNSAPSDFIGVYDDALSGQFCREIIDTFESFPQIQSAGKIGSGIDASKKDSLDSCISEYKEWTPINQRLLDVTLQKLVEYTLEYHFLVCGSLTPTVRLEGGEIIDVSPDNIARIPADQLKNILLSLYRPGYLNLQKYAQGKGGYHHWHSECYPREPNCETLHRVLLFMFFLNDVEEGGQTDFYYQQRSIPPKAGRMVIAPAGFTHTHKGNVPESSDKYIVTSWILFQRSEQLFGKSN